jgi:hypothetical protein
MEMRTVPRLAGRSIQGANHAELGVDTSHAFVA